MNIYFECAIILIICEILILDINKENIHYKKSLLVFFHRIIDGASCIVVLFFNWLGIYLAFFITISFLIIVRINFSKIESLFIILSILLFFLLKRVFDINDIFSVFLLLVFVPMLIFYFIIKPVKKFLVNKGTAK